MKLHTVFVTYNRLELTKQAFASYLETVTLPREVWIADNASTDGTQEWIHSLMEDHLIDGMMLYKQNQYPGRACNETWSHASDNVTHFHRADNDFIFLPGWCDVVAHAFAHSAKLGQLGLRTPTEESSSINVGGNCVIRRKLWNQGLRWDERPWPQIRDEVGAGWTEDSLMSTEVRNMGYVWARARKPCIRSISYEDAEDPYYQGTWADRGIHGSAT